MDKISGPWSIRKNRNDGERAAVTYQERSDALGAVISSIVQARRLLTTQMQRTGSLPLAALAVMAD